MLTVIGDILNWAATGIVFPLMVLPVAILIAGKNRTVSAFIWPLLVFGTITAGLIFIALVPRLDAGDIVRPLILYSPVILVLGAVQYLGGGLARLGDGLARAFDRVVTHAGRLVMWLAIIMALVQFVVVMLRYVFGINFIWMQESVTYMYGALFLGAAGYALLTNDHVRVDIFYSKASARRKALIDFLGTHFLLFPLALVTLWTAGPYVANSWAVFESSAEASGLQGVFLIKALIPIFALLLAMAGFSIAVRAAAVLRGGER